MVYKNCEILKNTLIIKSNLRFLHRKNQALNALGFLLKALPQSTGYNLIPQLDYIIVPAFLQDISFDIVRITIFLIEYNNIRYKITKITKQFL